MKPLLALLAVLIAASCNGSIQCLRDTDCRRGDMCARGACVPIPTDTDSGTKGGTDAGADGAIQDAGGDSSVDGGRTDASTDGGRTDASVDGARPDGSDGSTDRSLPSPTL